MKIKIFDKEDNIEKEAKLAKLCINHLQAIMKLQEEIMTALDNKSLFSPSNSDEYLKILCGDGIILGILLEETEELIAYGVFYKPGNVEYNYGYDIGINEAEIDSVGHIESTIVKVRFRGNELQKILCSELEKISKTKDTKLLCATASPENPYSVNTFKALGYSIIDEKLKYGGLRRYILAKKI